MLEDVSSSKLCFEEEIVKFVFVINMYLSAMKYFTCRLWSSFAMVQCHHPCKKSRTISSFKLRKSMRKQKDRVVLNAKSAKVKNITKWDIEKQKLKPSLYKIFLKVINSFASRDIQKIQEKIRC